MRLNKLALAFILAGSSALLVACGGGGSDAPVAQTKVVTGSTTATLNATTGAAIASALAGTTFSFATGVPSFGTTGPTTVGITRNGNSPGFNIGAAGSTATGPLSFGSCIFNVSGSTFDLTSPIANSKVVTVNPCAITIDTAGVSANGTATSKNVTFNFAGTTSAGTSVVISVSATGEVSINGTVVGTATLVAPTGVN